MSKLIQAVRGMNDIFPPESSVWQKIEDTLRLITHQYGYEEIRTPLVEKTELFKRSIGEITDIVEKEMYVFEDGQGECLALRPEGTASCVRAALEQGSLYNHIQRYWYMGPMFRHERPQKGRYRQFHQFGAEVFGINGAEIEAELIFMVERLWAKLGLSDSLTLQINTLGSLEDRANYKVELVKFFEIHLSKLNEENKLRLHKNPLRLLDSKNPVLQEIISKAPKLIDYVSDASLINFKQFQTILQANSISFTVNPFLVRGLDYYNDTVFEWFITSQEGSQNAVCAGGRYDSLVQQLGGQSTPAVGFAMGLERLLSHVKKTLNSSREIDVYVISVGKEARAQSLNLAEQIRSAFPHLCVIVDCASGSFKHQFKRADKMSARIALILGDDEVKLKTIIIKNLRMDVPQEIVKENQLIARIEELCYGRI